MSAADKQIADILATYGEPLAGNVWRVQGTAVIYHKALERIAAQARVTFEAPTLVRAERDEAVILVTGRMGERVEWSIGEALVGVNYRVSGKQAAYVYAMAEKRAKDRVILKLVGLHGLLYSEDEADEFREGRPAGDSAREALGGMSAGTSAASTGEVARDEAASASRGLAGRRAAKAVVAPVVAEADPSDATATDEAREPADARDEAETVEVAEVATAASGGEGDLRARIDAAASINAVTDLMLDPATQAALAGMPKARRDEIRDYAKSRLVALGWPSRRSAAAAA